MFSFTARKKSFDFQRYVRRLLDRTIPNSDRANTQRFENRHNRVLPVILCPLHKHVPDLAQCTIAITKDISDQGVGLIMSAPFSAKEVAIGFTDPESAGTEPLFFGGEAKRNVEIGAGFWILGVRLTEVLNEEWREQLAPLMQMADILHAPTFEALQ